MEEKEIALHVENVKEEIRKAALLANRKPEEITLIAATKTQTSATIRAAIKAGISVCGENRVQEMAAHVEEDAYREAELHFIGQLQTNKVKQVVGVANMIQSVDSLRLLKAIEKEAGKKALVQDILVEVNIGEEENKGGVLPADLFSLIEQVQAQGHVRLRGLMCIPPFSASKEELRGFFARTRQLFIDIRNKIGDNNPDIDCLSMGMSGDFALAIEEGATMVRVGTALFGAREPIH